MSLLFQPLKAIWLKSWTKIWGYVQVAGASIFALLSELHTYISDPTFKSYLGDLNPPKYVISGIAIFGIITWLAHGRSQDESVM